jgi:chromosome segregation ATPase
VLGPPKLPATTRGDSEAPWWQWVDKRIDYRLEAFTEAVGEAMAQFVGRKVGPIERELNLLRREFTVLREEVGLERGLKALREEVATARAEIPKLPAIEARLEAKQARLDAEQTRLRHELDATKDKLGKVRVDQSIADFKLSKLMREQSAPTTEVEFETSTSRFVVLLRDHVSQNFEVDPGLFFKGGVGVLRGVVRAAFTQNGNY